MNSYNGFSPKQRYKALKWFKEQISQGLRSEKPKCCDICGQPHGFLQFHSENYSEPFGDHIGEIGLCYICHMMIHCRFKNPLKWACYKMTLQQGMRYSAYSTNNWVKFKKEFLEPFGIDAFVEPSDENNEEVIFRIESGYYLEARDGNN